MDKYDKIDFGDGQNTNSGDTLYDAFTKVNNAFDDIDNDINIVDTKLNDFIDKVEVDVAQLDSLINDLENNKADRSELNSEVNRLDNDINNLNIELTNTNNNIIDLTNEVDDKLALKADKSELNVLNDNNESAHDTFNTRIINLQDVVDNNYTNLSSQIGPISIEFPRLQNDVQNLYTKTEDNISLKSGVLKKGTSDVTESIWNIDLGNRKYSISVTPKNFRTGFLATPMINFKKEGDNQQYGLGYVVDTDFGLYKFENGAVNHLYTKPSEVYLKSEVDNLIENVEVDLTGYATTDYVDSSISNIDFPTTDLSNYYTKTETYNKTEVDDLILNSGGGEVDLTDYYTKSEVNTKTVFGNNANGNSFSVAIGPFVDGAIESVAIGMSARTDVYGVGIGKSAYGGWRSVAIGLGAESEAQSSVAIGEYSINNSVGGIVIGRYNDPILEYPEYDINEEHPLFIIGNGKEEWERSNAFVMLQNGKSEFTNVASYKSDYSASFTDSSLVNKKYVDDLVANSGGGGETDLSNYYTKTEVDTELSSYAHAQITYVDNQLILKADKLTTYTKSEVDNLLNGIDLTSYATTDYVDSAVSNIDFPETDLSNYYTKTEIYNKSEVDDLVAGAGGGNDLSNYYTKTEVDNKVVFGNGANANEMYSGVAVGESANANGIRSVAIGLGAKASGNTNGYNTVAIGYYTHANADNSVAIGNSLVTNSFGGITIGRNNDPVLTSQQYSYNPEHPLFIIGNGTNSIDKSNAFVMLQNGKSEFTNVASYKEDYSANFTDSSLVNKKYVDDLVAGELVILNNSSTVDLTWNNDIIICDSATDIEILIPSGLTNLSFVIRNIGEGNVTLTTDGTSYFHATSSGQTIETGQITSVIIQQNRIISTGTI